MDKRISFPGGEIGVTNTELDLMPNANRGGIHALGAGLGNGSDFILDGVNAVITAGVQVTVQAGHVVLDGEVLKVDAQVVPRTVGTDVYVFQKQVVDDLAEYDRDYRNANTHNVAEIIRAVPVNVAAAAGGLEVDGPDLLDLLRPDIRVNADWSEADSNDPAYIQNKPIIQDVRNVGRFGPIDYGAGGNPASVEGDLANVVHTGSDSDGENYTVTLNNAMSNTQYFVRSYFRSNSGSMRNATGVRPMVWRPISTSSFSIHISESIGAAQDVTVYLEVVDYVP